MDFGVVVGGENDRTVDARNWRFYGSAEFSSGVENLFVVFHGPAFRRPVRLPQRCVLKCARDVGRCLDLVHE